MISNEEFDACVEKYADMVLRIAVNYCRSMEDAEDIVQDVFFKLLQTRTRFKDEEHRKCWLIRVTANQCKNHLRSSYHQRVELVEQEKMIDDKDSFHQELFGEDVLKTRVFEAVTALPEKLRIVVHLYYYEDYSVKEIAKILKKSESVILTRLHRARAKMKEELKGCMMSDGDRFCTDKSRAKRWQDE